MPKVRNLLVVELLGFFGFLIETYSTPPRRTPEAHLLDVEPRPNVHEDALRLLQPSRNIKGGGERHEDRLVCLVLKILGPLVLAPRTSSAGEYAVLDGLFAVAELDLRRAQFREGGGEMLQLLVQLLLDRAELLSGEVVEVDCDGSAQRYLSPQKAPTHLLDRPC